MKHFSTLLTRAASVAALTGALLIPASAQTQTKKPATKAANRKAPKATTTTNGTTKTTTPVVNGVPATKTVDPAVTTANGTVIVPNNGVIYNPYGGLGGTIIDNSGGNVGNANLGSGTMGNNRASAHRPNGTNKTSVPPADFKGRPITVKQVPRTPAGAQPLSNDPYADLLTGIVGSTPSKSGFILIVGKERMRIFPTRALPTGLSRGDLVTVQGNLRGKNMRAGAINISR